MQTRFDKQKTFAMMEVDLDLFIRSYNAYCHWTSENETYLYVQELAHLTKRLYAESVKATYTPLPRLGL